MIGIKLYERKVGIIASVAFILSCVVAHASVTDLRKAICDEASLIHHFSFESTQEDLNTPRLEDNIGSSRLTMVTRETSAATYAEGADSLSMGGTSVHGNDGNRGSAWITTNAIALPSTMTIECLYRPDQVPSYDIYGGISTKDGVNRGYYILQSKSSELQTRIGAGAYRTIVSNYVTGHWYYVACTYSVNAGKTTINSYYADLTAGDELQHPIVNEVENGNYGSSAVLGVGCLYTTAAQYFTPSTIDEVAIYDAVLDIDTIDSHYTELKYEVPTVGYREIFPDDTGTTTRYFPQEGWKTHWSSNAVQSVLTTIEGYPTAFDEDLEPIASFPQDTGVTLGYLSTYHNLTCTNTLYWTEEMTSRMDVSWLKMVKFDSRFVESRNISFALRVDINSTTADTTDDVWFYGLDFDQAPGTSLLAIPRSTGDLDWSRHWFEPGSGEWASLDFEAGLHLNPGETKVSLPTNGRITAFGFFEELHVYKKNDRLDNVTLYSRRTPPTGTLIIIQ